MKPLRIVPAGGEVLAALREALAGGPALFVAAPGSKRSDLPAEVEQRITLIVETSGSSGTPKRVALSADAVLANAGAIVATTDQDAVTVSGLPVERVVALLTEGGVSFTGIAEHRPSLEEAYIELTQNAVEFRSADGEVR